MLAVAIAFFPGVAEQLQFDRSQVLAGQWHRLLTCHLTHFGTSHLAWDAAVLLLLGVTAAILDGRKTIGAVVLSMAAIPLVVLVAQPSLQIYRGLSGIDSALFGLIAVMTARQAKRQHNRTAIVIALTALGGFIMKTTYELATGHAVFVDSQQAGFAPVPLAHIVGVLCGTCVALLPKYSMSSLRRLAVPVTMLLLMFTQSGCLTTAMWRRGVRTTVQNPQVVSGKSNGAVLVQYGEGSDTTKVMLPIERTGDAAWPLRYSGTARSLKAIEQDVSASQASAVNRCVLPLDWPMGSGYFPEVRKTGASTGAPSEVLDVDVIAFDGEGNPVGDIVRLGNGKVSARFPTDSAIYFLPKSQPRAPGAIAGDTAILMLITPLSLAVDLVITPVHLLSRSPMD